MFIIRPSGVVYEGETDDQAAENERKIEAHNQAWQKNLDAWKPGKPAQFYEKWCRKYAPHLMDCDNRQENDK